MAVFSFTSFARVYFTRHECWLHLAVHFCHIRTFSFPSIFCFKAFHGAVLLFAESYGPARDVLSPTGAVAYQWYAINREGTRFLRVCHQICPSVCFGPCVS